MEIGAGKGRPAGPRKALCNLPVWIASAAFVESSS